MRCPACKGAGFKLPDEGINVFGGLMACAECNGSGVVGAASNDEPVTRLERIVCAMIRTGAFYHPDNEEFAPHLVLKAATICDFMRKVELNQQFGKFGDGATEKAIGIRHVELECGRMTFDTQGMIIFQHANTLTCALTKVLDELGYENTDARAAKIAMRIASLK